MPSVSVLAGLLTIVSFSMTHSQVVVEGTDWCEPVIVWIAICMPTWSGKSGLCKFLKKAVDAAYTRYGLDDDAPSNFNMKHTALSVGGFIQPSAAKILIEAPQNIEKGLSQRFLWLSPKPCMVPLEDLQRVDLNFSASLGTYTPLI